MSRSDRPKLALRKETLRKLAAGDLGRVAGGFIARCTYERSGCYGEPNPTQNCMPEDPTGGGEDSCRCL